MCVCVGGYVCIYIYRIRPAAAATPGQMVALLSLQVCVYVSIVVSVSLSLLVGVHVSIIVGVGLCPIYMWVWACVHTLVLKHKDHANTQTLSLSLSLSLSLTHTHTHTHTNVCRACEHRLASVFLTCFSRPHADPGKEISHILANIARPHAYPGKASELAFVTSHSVQSVCVHVGTCLDHASEECTRNVC